jgi:hypothetical protein
MIRCGPAGGLRRGRDMISRDPALHQGYRVAIPPYIQRRHQTTETAP